ncbi:MAG: hypothetical protein B6I28_00485 [Fusobacteriia bacterium 4572_132]|nr:MAG: hypothetical protein B6I28_00485 [Fusobacteriia bacterium 4572_132]
MSTENNDMRNSAVPTPPKPGEVIVCQICGKKMMPEDFSKNSIERKKEFKWQCHWECMQNKLDECDRKTPGLLSERNR